MSDQLIDTWLKHTAAGTLDAHMWRHPSHLTEMYRLLWLGSLEGDVDLAGYITFRLHISEVHTRRRGWRNWDLTHIQPKHRIYVVAALCDSGIDQAGLNFLTGADLGATYGVDQTDRLARVTELGGTLAINELNERVRSMYIVDGESQRLADGLARQMIEEAAPHRGQAVLGAFDMERTPLQYIDSLITYESLRMMITPRGIAASFIEQKGGEVYALPFWWTPENHTCWLLGGKEAFAVHVLMACIWRDACIVRHRTFHARSRAPYQDRGRKRQRKKLILPRTIFHCEWSLPEERERIIRSRHSVRAFFRTLPEGQKASDAALDHARQYGYPLPPEGFTFVRPHQRGSGAQGDMPQPITPVVCTGLQTAAIALNWQPH